MSTFFVNIEIVNISVNIPVNIYKINFYKLIYNLYISFDESS